MRNDQENTPRRTRRGAMLALLVLSSALTMAGLALSPSVAQAAPITINQCNGIAATGSGATTRITCTVTVVNTIDRGVRSSVTTVMRDCALGACPEGNGPVITRSNDVVTQINQCNNSGNDAANPMICRVTITNNISADTPGALPLGDATINQCVGSGGGGGGSVVCDPFPATTTSATITQCNGSANGGGGTVECTVGDGSISPAVPVRVNQCNDSNNNGGSTVTCETSIRTNIIAAPPTPTPTATPVVGAGGDVPPQVSDVPTGGVSTGGGSTSGSERGGLLAVGGALALIGVMGLLLRGRLTSTP